MKNENNIYYDNAFTFVRYIIAMCVLIKHAIKHFGISNSIILDIMGIVTSVPVFFCISGFLIYLSLEKENNFNNYFKKRFLRIYPELWLCVVVGLLVIVIQYPRLLTNPTLYLFGITQSTLFQAWTPSDLSFYGVGVPNGSLWTICVFMQFYFLIFYTYKYIKKLNIRYDLFLLVTFILINVTMALLENRVPEIIYMCICQSIIPYLFIFYLGILICKYRAVSITYLQKNFIYVLIVFLSLSLFKGYLNKIPHVNTISNPISCIINGIFWVAFAYKFKQLYFEYDISFGIYLYHMIFVNLFIHNNTFSSVYLYLILVVSLTAISAIFSKKICDSIVIKIQSKMIR